MAGYLSRERGWLAESTSRRVHFHTVTWTWSAATFITLWQLPAEPENLWLAVIQVAVVTIPAVLIIPIAKWAGCNRQQVGTMACGAGVCNIGFTLGGYLVYALLEPSDVALSYAGVATSVLAFTIVIVLYPIANRFAPRAEGEALPPLATLIRRSLLSWPAMPLYASVAGVSLAVAKVPFPEELRTYGVVEVVLYAVNIGGNFGTGMRVRLGGALKYTRQHLVLASFVFGVTPLITWVILRLSTLTPQPAGPLTSQVMLVEAFMPTGVSIVILSNVFHLDARMAGTLWLWNTLAFLVLILPVMLVVL